MVTVTSPTGVRIQYNDGWCVQSMSNGMFRVSTAKENGSLIAWVPNSWAIEWEEPCRTYNATDGDALRQVAEFIESKPNTNGTEDGYLERIKRGIASFDLRRRCFR